MKQHAYNGDTRNKDAEKLSSAMRQMLLDVRDHDATGWSLKGRSAHGGGHWTHRALIKRGMLTGGGKLTPTGDRACAVEWRDARAPKAKRP